MTEPSALDSDLRWLRNLCGETEHIRGNAVADRIEATLRAAPAQGEPVAGEAIFEECAEIAEEHSHGTQGDPNAYSQEIAYDQACRDIAEAIRTRASNRKTMDALATKDSHR